MLDKRASLVAKKWRDTHKKERAEYARVYRKTYPALQAAKKYRRRYYLLRREQIRAEQKIYRQLHKNEIASKTRQRRHTDIQFRLAHILRSRLQKVVGREWKSGSAVRDLGCSAKELKFYLEGKFQDGMTWENYGLKGWHIDHVIPLSYFDLADREQFLRACHYTNLQPLWSVENIKKGNKLVYSLEGSSLKSLDV